MLIDPKTLPPKDNIPRIDPPTRYKKRVLFIGEASFLNTGFSVYYKNLLSRLFKTEKYTIAEFASYATSQDPRWLQSGAYWKYYGNMPDWIGVDQQKQKFIEHPEQAQLYYGQDYKTYQFGEWRFNSVLLDFKPDIVVDIRDWWMIEYQQRNPFRKNFIWTIMPTVDGDPQSEEWIETYKTADYVLTYSKYGKRVLEAQSGKQIQVIEIAQPGFEPDLFKPVEDKAAHRTKWMLRPDINIVGTVMRNQKRKLFSHLMRAFAKFKQKYPELAKKTALLLHTSFPDIGSDLPRFIKRYGLIHNVVFTYVCDACKFAFVNFWIGAQAVCRKCGQKKAHLPNTSMGVTREQLAEIYQLMDVYVQYSICEGWGMSLPEAKSCSVPVLATNNTAMAEQVGEGQGGWPIELAATYIEFDTWCTRGIPSDDDFIDKLSKMLTMSDRDKKALQKEAVESVKGFDWDTTAKKWEALLDAIPIKDRAHTWDALAKLADVKYTTLEEMGEAAKKSNEEFVDRLYTDILSRTPDEKGFDDWVKALKQGTPREDILRHFVGIAMNQNALECARTGLKMEDKNVNIVEL